MCKKGSTVMYDMSPSCHEGGSYRMPLMPPLPVERVSECPPFTYTGIDYFGPLLIKSMKERQKVWVCLYTCLVTRAIHLEMMHDMSTSQFLPGFRRFIARHGKRRKIISDNAAQFKLASDTIKKLWGQILTEDDVIFYAANQNVQWEFTVELAPWMGGFYERLLGLVKRSLRKALGKVCLTNEQLMIVLKEAEAVVNSRPLTYVGDDINSYITLTPAHFLSLNPKAGLPAFSQENTDDTDYSSETTSSDRLVALWKKGLKHLDSFRRIWIDDYLLSILERSQRKLKERRTQLPFNANVGDMVPVKDDLPRGMWRIGRLYELIESRDGHIPPAKVLLPSKKTIGRPLCPLYPRECQETDDTDTNCPNRNFDDQTNGGHNNEPDHGATNVIRPKRLAASIAKQRISEQLRDS